MSFRLLSVFLFITLGAYSQQTAVYTDPASSYETGLNLFQKQKFTAAQKEFKHILDSDKNVPIEIKGNAAYYHAVCAAELFHKDAESLLLSYMVDYPENPNYLSAQLDLGNFYYRQKKYKKAQERFVLIDQNDLGQQKRDELNFRLGYAYYMTNDYEQASKSFFNVKDGDSKYASAAGYYYSHMAYVNGNYETALKGFMKLKDSESFGPVAPYYITQIYYKQGKYDELIRFAPGALDSVDAKNGLEIGRMVGESHYRKGNYREALPYLLDYEKNSSNAGRQDYYQIGYCHYKTGSFEKAISYFQKVTSQDDAIAQNAYFMLADSYLKTNAKRSARTAFQSAAKMTYDNQIREESAFNYAKLSNELNFHSVAVESFRSFVRDFPNSVYVDEANELLVALYSNTRNYKDALSAIESIKVKSAGIKQAYQKVAYFRGIELFMDNNNSEAIRLFNVSLSNPHDQNLVALAHYWKAEAHYRLSEFDKALKSYNDFLYTPAAVKSQYYNLANYNIGYTHFKKEDYKNSQTAFRKYLQEKSQSDPGRYNDAIIRVADCFFMMRDQANALDYYNQAIAANAKSSDYAIFQKAIIQGVQGRMNDKVATLQKLFDKYPKSVYYDDALYEAGSASMIAGNNAQALTYYRKVITDFPGGSYVKKAELGEALVYYNNNEDDKALAAYQNIVKKYPNTPESREALAQIRNISVSQNKVNQFLDYVKTVPNADISKASEDSLSYEAAELLYTQGKCDQAIREFDSYLSKYPDALFRTNANYYKADCLFRNKQYEKALTAYNVVIDASRNSFTEKSLLHAGLINFHFKEYVEALNNFSELENIAEIKENILASQAGQMRCNFKLEDYARAQEQAKKIIDSNTSDKDLMNEAHLIAGKSHYFLNELEKAKISLSVVSKRTNSEMTAESKYYLAAIEYKQSNYKESQKIIFEIQKQVPSYDYWVAKGFILLGDNYLAQADTFQARETYKSIVDNFEKSPGDPDDLREIARQKLDALIADARRKEAGLMEQKQSKVPENEETEE
ncbi:MAG: outer membrane protein assembly factor BamD [Bacteroidetes bacterium]|nr:MAG: outer membrane protein assembly factor BamD [Bacteroidota bacterium]REK36456.1 MAG: outer membrane protein assembly factor BamD [Bacteroidota bacterium]REK51670.1 MAG: outer membrane protein assembly factor BamD [Bacteroidota bacterium]